MRSKKWGLFICWLSLLNGLFIVNELTLLAILALTRCCFMPFFAHFCFVIFVDVWSIIDLSITMSICAISFEFTRVILHPVFAKFSLVVKSKVFNILYHLFSGFKVHLLLGSSISLRTEIVIWVLLTLNFLNLLHQLIVRLLIREERLESASRRVHSNFV